jgi:hypothetical protein
MRSSNIFLKYLSSSSSPPPPPPPPVMLSYCGDISPVARSGYNSAATTSNSV